MKIRINKKLNVFPVITTIFFILLAGGCYSTYDYESYMQVYNGIYSNANMETAFAWLMTQAHSLGISYELFRLAVIAFCFTTLTIVAYRHVNNKVILIQLLYLFSAYGHDYFNLRNYIVTALLIIAFFTAVYSNKHGIMKYILIIAFAALFHRISLFFLLFIYPIFKVRQEGNNAIKKSRKLWICLAIIAGTIVVLSNTLLSSFASTAWNVVRYFTGALAQKGNFFIVRGRFGFLLYSMCHLMFTGVIMMLKTAMARQATVYGTLGNDKTLKLIETVNMCNIIMLFFIPMIKVNSELYRVFRDLQWIEYIAFFAGFDYLMKKSKERLLLSLGIVLTACVNYAVIVAPYAEKIFFTLFTHNRYLFN